MKFKKHDKVMLLKRYYSNDIHEDTFAILGDMGKVCGDEENGISVELERIKKVWVIREEDLRFVERTAEKMGECPICNSENLNYETNLDTEPGRICYPWNCDDCGAKGKENYSITYIDTVVDEIEKENE